MSGQQEAARLLAVAKSKFPSRSKSAVTIEIGLRPTSKLVAAPKPPLPSPNRMETRPKLLLLVTNRSGFPSLLTSAMAVAYAPVTLKLLAAPKLKPGHA